MNKIARRLRHRSFDIWPGYVDALASMLMMIAVVLLVLVTAQFYLANTINTKDVALNELTKKLRSIRDALSREQSTAGELRANNAILQAAGQRAEATIQQLNANLTSQMESEKQLQDQQTQLIDQLKSKQEESTSLSSQIAALSAEIAALNARLGAVSVDLTSAQTVIIEKDTKIADLDLKLKSALANKLEELADYRSEFFGKLKKALGSRADVRVVGDRFVFQSEVFFPSGSAELQPTGKEELAKIAQTLKELAATIPPDVNWILTVVGHTDKRPISTPIFPSNWELSIARALSVVKFLISAGIPVHRLAATGYGEHQPLDTGTGEAAFSKNRRIELKLNQK